MICSECKTDGWLQFLKFATRIALRFRAWKLADYFIETKVRAIEARHPYLKNKPQEW